MYKMLSSYYYIIFSYFQGIFVVIITHYFLKGLPGGGGVDGEEEAS